MNYSALLATINANIKRNGNQEITGDVLNRVLNSMVSSLGVGYQFMGVANPDDNPGIPDCKVAYLAGEGTYTHFGGVVIYPLEYALITFDTAWDKVVLNIATIEDIARLDSKIGSVKADVDDVANALVSKAERNYVDVELGKKADKTDVNSALALKANSADVYDKDAIDEQMGGKANLNDVYTKSQADERFVSSAIKVRYTCTDDVYASDGTTILLQKGVSYYEGGFAPIGNYAERKKVIRIITDGFIKLPTNCSEFFKFYTNLSIVDSKKWDTSAVTDMAGLCYMGNDANYLTSIDVSSWDMSKVTSLRAGFGGCYRLQALDVRGWLLENITDMTNLFISCKALTSFKVSSLFFRCVENGYISLIPFNGLTNWENEEELQAMVDALPTITDGRVVKLSVSQKTYNKLNSLGLIPTIQDTKKWTCGVNIT